MQELARDCLHRFDAATLPECTCPSGNGSLRHPCPVHPADAASDPLRAAVQAAVDLIEAREWAEHFAECHAPGDELASRLEACITTLHNEAYGGEDRADAASEVDKSDVEWQDIGRLLHRAAASLPEGYEIQVAVEPGWAGVEMRHPDNVLMDYDDGNSSLSEQIERAIDAAIQCERQQGAE